MDTDSNRKICVYTMPKGHGRFQFKRDPENEIILISCYSENYMEPNRYPPDQDEGELFPVFGIAIPTAESARSWEYAFKVIAELMERNEIREDNHEAD